jgi:peptide subunit release factor 1 (eRF1)
MFSSHTRSIQRLRTTAESHKNGAEGPSETATQRAASGALWSRSSKPSEKRDDEAILSDLATASGEGLAILGLKPALSALSEGRVKLLLISTELQSQPGALCTSCRALSSPEAMCPICGAPTAPVDDIVEAAVERAVHSGECRFVRGEYLTRPSASE